MNDLANVNINLNNNSTNILLLTINYLSNEPYAKSQKLINVKLL